MDSVKIDIAITAEQYLDYYKGYASNVQAVALDGRRIQFPAALLRQFLTSTGINGRFVLAFDAQHKLAGIKQL